MTPLSLTLYRFGSFVEETTFVFPDGPGLFFMQGRNEAEPRLEANGTGKTTIWKALTWCLFGKDPRGMRAGDVANWEEAKGAWVAFEFTDEEGYRFTVKRTHSPNSWKLFYGEPSHNHDEEVDLTNDVTNPWHGMLQLEFEPWLNCVLMAQGEPMFLDLRPEPKATLFANVMGLDRWIERSARASKQQAVTEAEIRAKERSLAEIRGKLAGMDPDALLGQQSAWERSRQDRLAAIAQTYERDANRSVIMAESLETLRSVLSQAEQAVAKHAGKAKRCSECDQLIRDEKIEQLMRDEANTRRMLRDLENDRARLERSLDELEDRADETKDEENPFDQSVERQAREARSTRERIDQDDRALAALTERSSMLGFWVRGFKEIRLQLISEALEELAIEVNSCVTALGLLDWTLIFEVDRESKSGSITRGFNVFVQSPHNDRQVPWESWSGGESQRLRLAAQMGLANLIRSQTGASIALEVWDEPTGGMSARGINDLLESLAARARDEQRQIWVVDHRSLGYGGFDGGATIVKDRQGSRIE